MCPQELELLAYAKNGLSERKSEMLESHFVDCEDCRESLALFAKISLDKTAIEPVSVQEIKDQTASVIALIKQEEFRHKVYPKPSPRPQWYLQFRAIAPAVLVVTLAVGIWSWLPSDVEKARETIALAVKEDRMLEPRLSGNVEWSEYPITRGPEEPIKEMARLKLELAKSKISFAENNPSASSDARIELAKIYLATGKQENAKQALDILRQVESSSKMTPEANNDLGVALFQLKNYKEAIDYFTRALEISSDYNEALFNKALAESYAQNHDQARQDWITFINKSSDPKWKKEAENRLRSISSQ